IGLVAAMGLTLELGVDNIARELLRKRAMLVSSLGVKGYSILGAADPPESTSAILAFHRPGTESAPLHQKLLDAGIITSLRVDRSGHKYIRLSPHFYNTDAELDRLLSLL